MYTPQILYEDNHLIALNKRVGELTQGDRTGDRALGELTAEFIAKRDSKPGAAYIGVPHRLDRPVTGLLLLTKTSKALTRVTRLFREGRVKKLYWAVVEREPKVKEGLLIDYLVKNERENRSYSQPNRSADAKEAQLRYRVLERVKRGWLVEVELITGRHHQIRVQLSTMGAPIVGDLKYGASAPNSDGGILLHARSLSFIHPVRDELLKIVAPTPKNFNL